VRWSARHRNGRASRGLERGFATGGAGVETETVGKGQGPERYDWQVIRGVIDDATNRYLEEVAADISELFGPGIELIELALELDGPEVVVLRARLAWPTRRLRAAAGVGRSSRLTLGYVTRSSAIGSAWAFDSSSDLAHPPAALATVAVARLARRSRMSPARRTSSVRKSL
jgi:hypothetical protein